MTRPLAAAPSREHPPPLRTAEDAVATLRPARPLYMLRPDLIASNANAFIRQFPGTVMYAVKANPERAVIQAMTRGGIRAFDCASIEEIRSIRKRTTKAKIFFMHPVKSREAIREAYETHGVRAFSLDSVEELYKIVHETGMAPDLELFVRIATPSQGAVISLSAKFGADAKSAPALLAKCRAVASFLGIAFHVGFQCMEPGQYSRAIGLAADIIKRSGVTVDGLDVGGGFPAAFANLSPPAREEYMAEIKDAVAAHGLSRMQLFAEPGQCLVADAGSLAVRVELRRGDMLYLNDGTFGCLHDAATDIDLRYPVTAIGEDGSLSNDMQPFRLCGPTCTTEDMMPGPWHLPADIDEGDWIVFSHTGAYGLAMRTNFNGFGAIDILSLNA